MHESVSLNALSTVKSIQDINGLYGRITYFEELGKQHLEGNLLHYMQLFVYAEWASLAENTITPSIRTAISSSLERLGWAYSDDDADTTPFTNTHIKLEGSEASQTIELPRFCPATLDMLFEKFNVKPFTKDSRPSPLFAQRLVHCYSPEDRIKCYLSILPQHGDILDAKAFETMFETPGVLDVILAQDKKTSAQLRAAINSDDSFIHLRKVVFEKVDKTEDDHNPLLTFALCFNTGVHKAPVRNALELHAINHAKAAAVFNGLTADEQFEALRQSDAFYDVATKEQLGAISKFITMPITLRINANRALTHHQDITAAELITMAQVFNSTSWELIRDIRLAYFRIQGMHTPTLDSIDNAAWVSLQRSAMPKSFQLLIKHLDEFDSAREPAGYGFGISLFSSSPDTMQNEAYRNAYWDELTKLLATTDSKAQIEPVNIHVKAFVNQFTADFPGITLCSATLPVPLERRINSIKRAMKVPEDTEYGGGSALVPTKK